MKWLKWSLYLRYKCRLGCNIGTFRPFLVT